jgi:hypothetical protein
MENIKTWWTKQTKKTKAIVLVVSSLLALTILSSLFPQAPVEESAPVQSELSVEELKVNYFSDLDAVEADYFVSEQAGLAYLQSYCQNVVNGNTPATADAIDSVVASYCGTDLATFVGVTPAPSAPQSLDVEEFRKISEEKWGFGIPEEDGSVLDPVDAARKICEADTDWGNNTNFTFEGSFQEYAITSFCPEKLP